MWFFRTFSTFTNPLCPVLPAVGMIVELLVMLSSSCFAWKQCGFTLGSAQSHIPTRLCSCCSPTVTLHWKVRGRGKKRDFWWVFLQPVCVRKTACVWVCIEEKPKAQECEYKTIRALLRDRGSGSHLASGAAGDSTMGAAEQINVICSPPPPDELGLMLHFTDNPKPLEAHNGHKSR